MPTAPITDFGDALMTSLASALSVFLSAIPRVIGFALILIVGWFIAGLIGNVVASLLRAVKFNDLAERSGVAGFVRNMGVQRDAAGFLADIAKWFIRLIVLVVAFDALGLPAVSDVLRQLLAFLPNVVVAIVVLVLAGLAAKALGDLVRGSAAQAGLGNPDVLANVARFAIIGFGVVVAVNQLGIAQTLINTLFIGLVVAIAIGAGLAFGLGGQDTARRIVEGWYTGAQSAAPKMKQAAQSAGQQARDQVQSMGEEVGRQSPPRTGNPNDMQPRPASERSQM